MSSLVAQQPIVLVDNAPPIGNLLREVLEEEGYNKVVCLSAREALPTIRHLHPSLVVLDTKVSWVKTDLHLLKHLRDDPMTAGVPVLLLATAPISSVQATQMGTPGIVVVVKPFALDEFVAKVHDLIGAPAEATRRG
jgi:DNA-binding response OmpR family regulator